MTNNLNHNPTVPLAGTKLSQRACTTGILKGYSCPFMKQAYVENFFCRPASGMSFVQAMKLAQFHQQPYKDN